jgi:hypothetical protein
LVERYPVVKKKLSFHFEPLLNNPFIKKVISFVSSKILGDRLKITIVWVAILFCAAFMMKAEAFAHNFQPKDNVVTQKEIW